ncbi:CIS tube protein [Jiangella endophytica]|uniref:CIS tube protein n=1 Tax=Jiangella endophytica TaxID=1623398 RepID=UPI000E34A7BD|nr:LysM peptidoglycan-binding domain-containing protein [Jiangella endophytica]
MATEKAFLEIEGGERLPCLFNPAQLTVGRTNEWAADRLPGKGVPTLRYAGARSGWLRLELFFDTTHDGSPVTKYTGKIVGLMEVDLNLPGTDETTNNARPPYVTFHWGDLHSFKAVVSDLELAFTYFSSAGVPLRARLWLTLRQYEPSNAFGPQNPTSGTPRPHRVHRVRPGETLDRISAAYYGDATRWRVLAGANAIADPLDLRPGRLLSIPRLES